MNLAYTIQIERDEDGVYCVTIPALPGCFTNGRTIAEAKKRAEEAIMCYLEALVLEGEPIPIERPVRKGKRPAPARSATIRLTAFAAA